MAKIDTYGQMTLKQSYEVALSITFVRVPNYGQMTLFKYH